MKIKPSQKTPTVEDLKFNVELNGKEVCDLLAFFGTFSGNPNLYYRKEICTKWHDALHEIYKNHISKIDIDRGEYCDSSNKVYESMEDKSFGWG